MWLVMQVKMTCSIDKLRLMCVGCYGGISTYFGSSGSVMKCASSMTIIRYHTGAERSIIKAVGPGAHGHIACLLCISAHSLQH